MSDLIALKSVSKTYRLGDRELKVLTDLSMSVSAGEMIAITGISGVGKSTLLHIIGTLDFPTDGEISFEGINPFSLSPQKLAQFRNTTIGFVFQAHHLLPEFSACENVMIPLLIKRFSKKQARMRAESLLDEVKLSDRRDHKPGELSGGEQQRVAVARALINQPKVILADEPTGNLDEATGRTIHTLLKDINKSYGVTFIIATHNLHFASQTDRQLQLIDGSLCVDKSDRGE